MDSGLWIVEIASFVIALYLSALLSGAESVFLSVSRSALEKMAAEGDRGAQRMLKIHRSRHTYRSAVSIGQSLLSVLAASSLLMFILDVCGTYSIRYVYGATAAAVVASVSMVLCRQIPVRLRRGEDDGRDVRGGGLVVFLLHRVLFAAADALNGVLDLFSEKVDGRAVKEEELMTIVESESEEGVIEEGQKEMIQGILEFRETTVREVMVPRMDMVCVERSMAAEVVFDLITEAGHSRIPVYEGTIDRIAGILYVKDLLQFLGRSDGAGAFNVDDVMRTPYYVPENKKVSDLLREFRGKRIHMAVVVDEYGGTEGLVTLEDLLEEIVGEINDEYDEEESLFTWLSPGSLQADARIDIHELNAMLDVDLPTEGYGTLGGFVYHHLGRIPEAGESFDVEGLRLQIQGVDGQRISGIRIDKIDSASAAEEEE